MRERGFIDTILLCTVFCLDPHITNLDHFLVLSQSPHFLSHVTCSFHVPLHHKESAAFTSRVFNSFQGCTVCFFPCLRPFSTLTAPERSGLFFTIPISAFTNPNTGRFLCALVFSTFLFDILKRSLPVYSCRSSWYPVHFSGVRCSILGQSLDGQCQVNFTLK